jgi:membrane-bound metal-dependent hydrolase YbcI (DUF457 family)
MLKRSHRAFALSLFPLTLIKINNVQATNFEIFNLIINKYNETISLVSTVSIWPVLFLLAYWYGSTFPDIDHKFKYLYKKEDWHKRYLYHRQTTHSILFLSLMLILSLIYSERYIGHFGIIITAMSLGMFAHIIGDMMTGSVPWLLYAPYYRRFARIGITVFLPKAAHKVFTEKLPKYFDKNMYIFVLIFIGSVIVWLENSQYKSFFKL